MCLSTSEEPKRSNKLSYKMSYNLTMNFFSSLSRSFLLKAFCRIVPNTPYLGGEGGRGGRAQVRRGKNPRQGESLDKDQKQIKQYNYEQAKSTRHAGRPADFQVDLVSHCFHTT